MGLYISGMDMPNRMAVLVVYQNGYTAIYDAVDTLVGEAKAVPVSTHGRLGDLDELEKSFREDADAEWNKFATPMNWADAFNDIANIVADAPTIIPASED